MFEALINKYHSWRRSTMPASKADITWRHETTIREIQAIKRAAAQGGSYYYLGGGWGLTTLANGLPFYVNTKDRHIAPRIILFGKWEDDNDELIQDLVAEGDTCFDIGANLGYYTIRLAQKVGPKGKVYSFEPNPELFPYLKESVAINHFEGRSALYQNAVGSKAGSGRITFEYSNMGGGGIDAISDPGHGPIEIVAIDSLSDVPETVDFIKIDVEGMEIEAFRGMSNLLTRSPQCAIFSEYSYGAYLKYGAPEKLITEIAGNRSVFWLWGDGTFSKSPEMISKDNGANCYVLLVDEASPKFKRVSHRMR
jgi:FkbM family methyltransferase